MTEHTILSAEEVAAITEAAELGQRLGTHWHERELIEQNQRLLRLAGSHENLRARVTELGDVYAAAHSWRESLLVGEPWQSAQTAADLMRLLGHSLTPTEEKP